MGGLNFAHFHLVFNHVPTVGTVVALGELLVALAMRDEGLKRISLGVFFLIALVTLPVYITGNATAAAIKDLPGVSAIAVREHQDAAMWAFGLMEVVGVVAWAGLWQFRRNARLPRGAVALVLLLSALTLAAMTRAATLGGEIRHPEIDGTAAVAPEPPATDDPAAAPGFLTSAGVSAFVINYAWVWQASETVHFIGMCLLMGVLLAVNLRILGMIKRVPFAALHRLLPIAVLGFGLNIVSGMLFFIAVPDQYTQNPSFFWKMAFIVVGGLQVFYLTVFDDAWKLEAGVEAAARSKIVAGSTLFVWFGIIFWGTMLPFLGLKF